MVMRSSTSDASRRAQTSASRATIREMNSKPYWGEAKQIDVMASETASDVEYAENYGTTSVVAKQDKEEGAQPQAQQQQSSGGNGAGGAGGTPGTQGKQPKGDAAEAIVLYLNGSRSHPVIIAAGDRRHRLVELEEGDVAQHRLKDDRQQFLLSGDGTYLSTRSDKVMRIALVPKEQDQQQQQPQQGQQGQGQQQKKSYGQKSAKDDNKSSSISITQQSGSTTVQHGSGYSGQRDGDSSIYHGSRAISCQSTDNHSHIRCKGNHIWVDSDACKSDMPLIIQQDSNCKD